MIHQFKNNGYNIVMDVNSGSIHVVDDVAYDLIALYRDRIYEKVWGEEFLGDSRTVDLHIQRMRKKLGLENRLVAVYKVGYRLEVAD